METEMKNKIKISELIRVLREQQELYGDVASIEDMIDLINKKLVK
jgi:hypothetical protein